MLNLRNSFKAGAQVLALLFFAHSVAKYVHISPQEIAEPKKGRLDLSTVGLSQSQPLKERSIV